jgi:hypothetical protein
VPVDLAGDTVLAALVRGGQAGCRCGVPGGALLPGERAVAGGDSSTGTAKSWQPAGDGLGCHGPAGSRPAPAHPGLCAVGADGRRPGSWGRDGGRSAELADRLAGFANLPLLQSAS